MKHVSQSAGSVVRRAHDPRVIVQLLSIALEGGLWIPGAWFRFERPMVLRETNWTVCVALYASGERDREGAVSVKLQVNIRLMPPEPLVLSSERQLTRLGMYKTIADRLKRRGYVGAWRRSPHIGRWSDFDKQLRTLRQLWAEVRWLEHVNFDELATRK